MFTPMASAAMSWSRTAMNERPSPVRNRLRAASTATTARTSRIQYHWNSNVARLISQPNSSSRETSMKPLPSDSHSHRRTTKMMISWLASVAIAR